MSDTSLIEDEVADSSVDMCIDPDLTASMVDTSDDESIDPPIIPLIQHKRPINSAPPTHQLYSSIIISSDESGDDDDNTKTTETNKCDVKSFDPPTPLIQQLTVPIDSASPIHQQYSSILVSSDDSDNDGNTKTTETNKCDVNPSNIKNTNTNTENKEFIDKLNNISKVQSKPMFKWNDNCDTSTTTSTFKRLPESPMENENKKPKITNETVPCTVKIKGVIRRISEINIEFPLDPYPSQMALMSSLIRACKNKQNALLESPTGSGKTLALLCGALAWQRQENINYQRQLKEYRESIRQEIELSLTEPDMIEKKNGQHSIDPTIIPPEKPAKIYYGSRTHRQITQVVKELRRTAYRNVKMTILSSRDFTCIQETKRNKTEFCNELLDPVKKKGCPFYGFDQNNRSISNHQDFDRIGLHTPFDIEDLVNVGKEQGCCPYFAARDLMVNSDIIFCPYNYLIDPSIRQSMSITLKDNIIILDEAHNIEDICRDSGSTFIKINEISDIIKDCETFAKNFKDDTQFVTEPCPAFVDEIIKFCQLFMNFLKIMNLNLKKNNSIPVSKYWNGPELVQVMHVNQMSIDKINRFIEYCKLSCEQHKEAKENMRDPKNGFIPSLSAGVIRIIEKFIFGLMSIISDNSNDYVVYIKEIIEWNSPKTADDDVLISKTKETLRVIEFLCLNPGVVFKPISETARSVILASGTLSPLNSFASELQTKFITLQTHHVTPPNNVFIRAITKGINGNDLTANYNNVQTFNFQDNIAEVILDVCQTVPYGVLCFFSSYSVMNKITDRMTTTNIIKRIANFKTIYYESRTNDELTVVMDDYRKDCQNKKRGALLFAVFRGKIAEGIDFSDNEARAVITIGIPYSVKTDPAIECKLIYNNKNVVKKSLLQGQEWYTVSAFRALNQALGRCIRHRDDWGAIIMIDTRFLNFKNQSYLPKWVLKMWNNKDNTDFCLPKELDAFVKNRIKFYEDSKKK